MIIFIKSVLFCIIDAVLVTGGESSDARNTAELYHPSSGASCRLPQLPDDRHQHTVDSRRGIFFFNIMKSGI